jgi:hypothetical protein
MLSDEVSETLKSTEIFCLAWGSMSNYDQESPLNKVDPVYQTTEQGRRNGYKGPTI